MHLLTMEMHLLDHWVIGSLAGTGLNNSIFPLLDS